MNSDDFSKIFDEQTERCRSTLFNKAQEYATDDDRLHNFKVTAELKGETMQAALGGFMAKHTVSIYDMLRGDVHDFTFAQWNEKITDHINYLFLLKAVVEAQRIQINATNIASGTITAYDSPRLTSSDNTRKDPS